MVTANRDLLFRALMNVTPPFMHINIRVFQLLLVLQQSIVTHRLHNVLSGNEK